MAENLTRQILAEHLVEGELRAGTPIALRVDQTLLQDATGTMALMQFEQLDVPRVKVERAVQYVDHNVIQLDYKNPDDHRMLQALCRRYGIHFSRPGNGICHYVQIERFARPGGILVGADSHTTTSGALGMIAIGAGGLDVAVAMGGHPYEIACPHVVEVRLDGKLARPWVQAKDVILELLRRLTVRGGLNKVFEFTGAGTSELSVPERATIANMIAELGATAAVFPPDENTRVWLQRQEREDDFADLAPEDGCEYDERVEIDLDELGPMVAKPHNPDNVVPVEEVAGTPVEQVCIGSSVNSAYLDLALPAAVLAAEEGRHVHERCTATATPGSRQILVAIAESGVYRQLVEGGVRMLEPVCGPCVGMGQAPPSDANSLRTFNRNFPGRSGTPDDSVYLCSPAVAAVSMLYGEIRDPREYGAPPELLEMPTLKPYVDDVHIFAPAPEEEAESIEIPRGPNIKTPPEHSPLEDELSARIATVQPDNISTGDLAPDGVIVMSYRSNIPAIAEFTFEHRDPEFRGRMHEWGSGFIVGGHNYGQGSSREHAALAPLQLGVRAVFAKSFARIHRRNLVAQGILALTFADEDDYELAKVGDTWTLPNVKRELQEGAERIVARIEESDREVALGHDLAPKEREILVSGGLLSYLRERRRLPDTGLDLAALRARFPGLAGGAVLFDGPGGSQAPEAVIDAMSEYLRSSNANLGGTFRTSLESDVVITRARAAAADFTGSEPEEIAFGANMTTLNFLLAHAVARTLEPGDEIVVTDLDHDANVSPWLLVAGDHDLVVRSAPMRTSDGTLDDDALEALLGERTRVVAFTLASNALGSITDAARIAAAAGRVGALAWADAVHLAPHRRLRRAELGIDVLLCSPYKFFGPHLGVAAIERGLAERLPADRVRPAEEWPPGHRFETGTQSHEAIAGATAAVEYLRSVGDGDLDVAFERIRDHEEALSRRFLEAVPGIPGLDLYGIADPGRVAERTPTFCFNLGDWDPGALALELAARDIYVWHGDYYALGPMRALGLAERGAVRAGFLHYSTDDEVDRLLAALTELAGRA